MNQNTEIVEHKSNAHPDSLTDLIVEACAIYLDEYYKKNYGQVLHYNVDKALFLAGNVKIGYGKGEVVKDPCFILGGQASNMDWDLELNLLGIIRETTKAYLPNLNNFDIEIRTNNVSQSLNDIFKSETILANDTSFGVGYYPFSESEQKVFAIKKMMDELISGETIPLGEDYKIMLTPKTIMVCAPFYTVKVRDKKEYEYYRRQMRKKLGKFGKAYFNSGFKGGEPYLTLCGSSIECGDDGQCGRSNRYNGLITPCKPMTMECYSGKNNRNHIGKIYQRWAFEKAKEIYEETGKYTEVILVSKIGYPIEAYEMYVSHRENV